MDNGDSYFEIDRSTHSTVYFNKIQNKLFCDNENKNEFETKIMFFSADVTEMLSTSKFYCGLCLIWVLETM